ncbi:hypothetical protein J4573_44260 [Actinomadura barringtoniae]|uniref:Uncharacterized protein n=1 Tax=Actinomadura barringtoniae TaxID=1427535 RepID=A0A939PK07_9ACTN|nr:hypothetical protein [Actinomadura barringtoniae]MBO2454166.1 hypothetical protein [Actinomadura barringtoniae]
MTKRLLISTAGLACPALENGVQPQRQPQRQPQQHPRQRRQLQWRERGGLARCAYGGVGCAVPVDVP